MAGGETPAAALFYKRIGELNNDVDRFTLRVTFYFCLPRHDGRVIAVDPHLHVVVFENIVMDSATSGIFDIIARCGDFAL